ncbi:uncharacterized protein TRIVIDRAFT_198656 [Trichoderma virens Gv29-8]|uniref:Peptidase C14 caspase domain-containing protein n=1 Tax=Hypocrea virens (strain Gv29-8 / FGSC 10586) TaxID=413071 RepID=G9MJP9_HYPVG|nr:uncharacterized protein TRIVIDRAFT_198656 [Trichoderma virens Gv29-8]EHK25712.1 hypothetical protein TRIVIDRAFT_198656 [Trichoderma virens Gv29-8]
MLPNLLFQKAPGIGDDGRAVEAPDEAGYQCCQTWGFIIIETEKHGKVVVGSSDVAMVFEKQSSMHVYVLVMYMRILAALIHVWPPLYEVRSFIIAYLLDSVSRHVLAVLSGMSITKCQKVWVVLVGINEWEDKKIRRLHGCINDINDVEKKLRSLGNGLHLNLDIVKLTDPYERNSPLVPTYANVQAAFKRVRKEARGKDVFYFHFSGHGGRQKCLLDVHHPSQDSNSTKKFETLVLQGKRPLKDWELGNWLSELADDDLAVFAVLDCCYSGGGDRVDENVRELDFDMEPDEEIIPIPLGVIEKINAESIEDDRDGTAVDTWWSKKARKYTLLAACQPVEKAKENGTDVLKDYRGVFTKALMESLDKLIGMTEGLPTSQDLHLHVAAHIGQGQHPMIYGETNRLFLGYEQKESARYTSIVDLHEKEAYIGLGHLHGVCRGEKYRVHCLGATTLGVNDTVLIEIDRVYGTTARGKIPKNGLGIVQKGCAVTLAEAIAASALRVEVYDDALWEKLSAAEGCGVTFERRGSRSCMYELGRSEPEDETPAALAVTEKEKGRRVYVFPHDEPDILSMMNFFRKLNRYTRIDHLQNREQHLRRDFTFTEENNKTVVNHGEIITLVITNMLPIPIHTPPYNALYYAIFNLRPDLDIKLISPGPNEGTVSLSVPPSDADETNLLSLGAWRMDDRMRTIMRTIILPHLQQILTH